MKYLLLLSILLGYTAIAQDKIITLRGDTIDCRISEEPWKEKIRPVNKWHRWENGYAYLVAFWGTDSVRILKPNNIRGYYSHSHSRYLHGGYYESVTYYQRSKILFKGNVISDQPITAFLRRIYQSEYITVYSTAEDNVGDKVWKFYIRKPGKDGLLYFSERSDILSVFDDAPQLLNSPLLKKFRFQFYRVIALAEEYTAIKRAAENTKEQAVTD